MSKKPTVLVVDDDEQALQLLQESLAGEGYNLLSASDGAEAIKLVEGRKDQPLDLLVTDLVMPKVDGMELASRVLKLRPGLKVLFISGYADDVVMHRQDSGTATTFLPKPFKVDALRSKVKSLLGVR